MNDNHPADELFASNTAAVSRYRTKRDCGCACTIIVLRNPTKEEEALGEKLFRLAAVRGDGQHRGHQ